jgi:hypothetical protein
MVKALPTDALQLMREQAATALAIIDAELATREPPRVTRARVAEMVK